MKKILAKSEKDRFVKKTISEHSEGLLNILKKLSQNIDFNDIAPDFYFKLKILALTHDLGKMNIKFQNKVRNQDSKDIRHNLLSGTFLKYIFNNLNFGNTRHILYKSILLHHDNYLDLLDISKSDIQRAILKDIKHGVLRSNEYDTEEVSKFYKNNLFDSFSLENENILDYDYFEYFNKSFQEISEKKIYILYKGFLHILDHISSSQLSDYNYFQPFSNQKIDNNLISFISNTNNIDKETVNFYGIQNFTEKNQNKNIITKAFTGGGKTIADHRWKGEKKFYLVPTRVSAEAFYKDSLKIYEKEKNVGILHGDIGLYTNNREEQENEMELSISKEDNILTRNFAKPYIISTIDQLLLSMFKYPRYEKIFATLYNAKVTVDEVHLLSPRMFLILTYFIDFCNKNLSTKFHLMTATMPKLYEKKLNQLKNVNFEENISPTDKETSKIKTHLIDENNILNKIKESLNNDNQILVIKNTVDGVREVYRDISKNISEQYEINCLHSRFKFKDKRKKYENILSQKGDIWIATQSIEVALDIDFPVVISDLAPMESLIQRMGRCNRENKIDFGGVNIINKNYNDVYKKDLKNITKEILENEGILSMKDREILLKKYFSKEEIEEEYINEFDEAERSIKYIYGLNEETEINGEKLILNYDPHLNIVDNKQEAEKLFRNESMPINILLKKDYNQISGYTNYRKFSIPITKYQFKNLYNNGMIFRKDSYFILKPEALKNYDEQLGLETVSINKNSYNNII